MLKYFSSKKNSGSNKNKICACICTCILQLISMFGACYYLTKDCMCPLDNLDGLNVDFFLMSDLKKGNKCKLKFF